MLLSILQSKAQSLLLPSESQESRFLLRKIHETGRTFHSQSVQIKYSITVKFYSYKSDPALNLSCKWKRFGKGYYPFPL